MTLPKHLEEAVAKLEQASYLIEQARAKSLTLDSVQEWLEGLTGYVKAATEIQQLNNESVHEKLHELAGRVGLRQFPTGGIAKD